MINGGPLRPSDLIFLLIPIYYGVACSDTVLQKWPGLDAVSQREKIRRVTSGNSILNFPLPPRSLMAHP